MNDFIITIISSAIVSFLVSFLFMIKAMKLISTKTTELMDNFFREWDILRSDFLKEMDKKYFK